MTKPKKKSAVAPVKAVLLMDGVYEYDGDKYVLTMVKREHSRHGKYLDVTFELYEAYQSRQNRWRSMKDYDAD